jgi:hypothetical protein
MLAVSFFVVGCLALSRLLATLSYPHLMVWRLANVFGARGQRPVFPRPEVVVRHVKFLAVTDKRVYLA